MRDNLLKPPIHSSDCDFRVETGADRVRPATARVCSGIMDDNGGLPRFPGAELGREDGDRLVLVQSCLGTVATAIVVS